MQNLNIKNFWYIVVALSAVVFFLVALLKDFDLSSPVTFARLTPTVATVDGLCWVIFSRWLWKWNFLQGWLVLVPNLNGTWKGDLQSDWKDENGNTVSPIPTLLTIKQSLSRTSCVMRTGEMESFSYAEGFRIDKDSQQRKFVYSYTSRPSAAVRERSKPHDGTILFNIVGSPITKLTGEYWTQRKTTGTATLERYSDKLIDEMPKEMPPHPMSK